VDIKDEKRWGERGWSEAKGSKGTSGVLGGERRGPGAGASSLYERLQIAVPNSY